MIIYYSEVQKVTAGFVQWVIQCSPETCHMFYIIIL